MRMCVCARKCRSKSLQENVWILELVDHPPCPHQLMPKPLSSLGARGTRQTLRSPVGFIPTHYAGSSLCAPLHLCLMGNWGQEEQIREEPVLGVPGPTPGASSPSAPPLLTEGSRESPAQAPPHLSGPLPSATPAITSSAQAITHSSPSVPHC